MLDLARQGWREFRAHPAVSAAAALMLALGIAGATTMFTMLGGVFNAMVPPGVNASRVGRIVWSSAESSGARGPVASADFMEIAQARLHGIDELSAYADGESSLGPDGPSLEVKQVSATFFATFGFRVSAGRSFTVDDERPGQAPIAIVSAGLLRRSPSLRLGGRLDLGNESRTIVGVLPDEAWFPSRGTEVWLPLEEGANGEPRAAAVTVAFRLRDGTSIESLREEVGALGRRLAQTAPAGDRRRLRPITLEEEVSTRRGGGFIFLLAPALVVLLIACANVANLLLARAARREREMAVRTALGASRWRLVRERMAESATLALVGGTAGTLLAFVGVRSLRAWLASLEQTEQAAGMQDLFRLDAGAVFFAVAVTMAVPLVFGLVPALKGSRPNLVPALQHGPGRRKPSRGPYGGRDLLVIVEIGLAVVLVVFGAMLGRFFQELGRIQWGFDADRVVAVEFNSERAASNEGRARLAGDLLARARQVPGVSNASLGSLQVPDLPRPGRGRVEFEGCANPGAVAATPFSVDGDYFATLGTRVVTGRLLTARDVASGATVAVVSAKQAERCWPKQEALGRRVTITIAEHSEVATVVGVVPDAVTTRAIGDLPQPVYLPTRAGGPVPPLLLVRVEREAGPVIRSLLAALRTVEPVQTGLRAAVVGEGITRQLSQTPVMLRLIGGFAVFALLLGGLGVFAVTSYMVAERTREFGVRIALGASPWHVVRLVMGQAATTIAIGAVVAIAGTLAVARATFHQLADLAVTDLPLWLGVATLLAFVAITASLAPARRAVRIQPVEALRIE